MIKNRMGAHIPLVPPPPNFQGFPLCYDDHQDIAGTVGNSKPNKKQLHGTCLLYTSPSPRDRQKSRMPSSA